MVLSNVDIINRINLEENDPKRLVISNFNEKALQPASYDITLGNSFKILESKQVLNINTNSKYKNVTRDSYILYPKKFVLATTREFISIPLDLVAIIDGRSSYGRMGIDIQNAGWIDPGFKGELTLEIRNESSCPVMLNSGTRIGQLVFLELLTPASYGYNGKYYNQTGATGMNADRE